MRIILFNFHGNKPNPVYEVLAQSLRKRGHEVIVGARTRDNIFQWRGDNDKILCSMPLSELSQQMKTLPLLPRLHTHWMNLKLMLAARAYVKRLAPDIVQMNTYNFPWLLSFGFPPNMHSIFDIRQINESMNTRVRTRLRDKLNKLRFRFWSRHLFDHTVFLHQQAAEHIVGADWPRFASVVPLGIDANFLRLIHERASDFDPNHKTRFVYVGTLSKSRNLEQLFHAAALLKQETDSFMLSFIGPDRSNGQFQETIEKLKLTDIVSIEPPLPYEEIPKVLSGYDVGMAYVPDRPTWHYAPTIKIFEYIGLGLPLLSTNVASHRELFTEGVNGVMVEDSPASIAAGMRRFVLEPGFLESSTKNARTMRGGLTWDQIAAMYEAVYESLNRVDPK
jgi:glycosyltransferase involved in cell wall biosynthesis